MIKIEHLVKNYGTTCAVDDISFAVDPLEYFSKDVLSALTEDSIYESEADK